MVKRDSKVHRSHVLIGVMVVVIVGLIVFACTQRSGDSKTADLPKPAGSGSAIAGQGYSTGSYDHEYQLYNNWYQDGSVTSYLVENGNWVYLDTLDASGAQSNAVGSRVTYGDLTFKVLNHGVELDTPCDTYSVAFGSGKYGFASTRASLTMSVSSGAQPIQQITGSQDAVTIHNTFPGVGWFTLHCDNAAVAAQPAPTPTPAPTQACTDSDGGQVLGIRGTASGNWGSTGQYQASTEDWCDVEGGPRITEFYCDSAGLQANQGYCPSGTVCRSGACVATQTAPTTCSNTCQDSTHLLNYTNGCASSPTVTDCTQTGGSLATCSNGQCVAPNCANGACASACTDSDGGNVLGVNGTASGYRSWGSYERNNDRCDSEGSMGITEWYCDAAGLQYSYQYCSSGKTCRNGACV